MRRIRLSQKMMRTSIQLMKTLKIPKILHLKKFPTKKKSSKIKKSSKKNPSKLVFTRRLSLLVLSTQSILLNSKPVDPTRKNTRIKRKKINPKKNHLMKTQSKRRLPKNPSKLVFTRRLSLPELSTQLILTIKLKKKSSKNSTKNLKLAFTRRLSLPELSTQSILTRKSKLKKSSKIKKSSKKNPSKLASTKRLSLLELSTQSEHDC